MALFDLSIVIVTFNTKKLTSECIRSIYNSKTNFTFEIILIDNNSIDETSLHISNIFPNVNLYNLKENVGFSKANNIGIKNANGNYVLLLNSDTILFSDSINNLLSDAIKNQFLIASPILLNKDESLQKSTFKFPNPFKTFLRLVDLYPIIFNILSFFKKSKKSSNIISKEIQYVSFACVLIKNDVFNIVGLLDENLFFYHEDCEFGLRVRLYNIKINLCESSKIIHLGGSSSKEFSLVAFENDIMGLLYVFKKHYNKIIFNLEKSSIILALSVRIILWYFGLYRRVKKISIYKDSDSITKNNNLDFLIKYKTVCINTLKYKYK